ncbi:hypothetical protein MKW98_000192, partial [Papaver atlanticum]
GKPLRQVTNSCHFRELIKRYFYIIPMEGRYRSDSDCKEDEEDDDEEEESEEAIEDTEEEAEEESVISATSSQYSCQSGGNSKEIR